MFPENRMKSKVQNTGRLVPIWPASSVWLRQQSATPCDKEEGSPSRKAFGWWGLIK
jgi:hypothetical protein